MKVRPLVITDTERAAIKKVIAHAEQNVFSVRDIFQSIQRKKPPVGDVPAFVCVVPFGYRCVFSFEHQPHGQYRHLSVSVLGDGVAPNPEAVQMLATEFGFRGQLDNDMLIWTEPFGENKIAVNVAQSVAELD